jgi:hypothetical protein
MPASPLPPPVGQEPLAEDLTGPARQVRRTAGTDSHQVADRIEERAPRFNVFWSGESRDRFTKQVGLGPTRSSRDPPEDGFGLLIEADARRHQISTRVHVIQ